MATRSTFHSILTLLFCLLRCFHLLAQPHEYAGPTPCQFFELLPCIPWKMCWPELCTAHSIKQKRICPVFFTSWVIHCAVWKIHLFFSFFLPAKQNKSRALILTDIDLHLSIYKKDVHKSIWTPEFILRQKYCSSFKIIISKRNFANQPHILFSSSPPFGENVYSTLQTLPKRGLLQYALIVN